LALLKAGLLFKELKMTEAEFKRFMKKQLEEIKKYKWIESEKAGKDLGNDCCIEWVTRFAKKFRDEYLKEIRSKS
jgi:hypothetical protein